MADRRNQRGEENNTVSVDKPITISARFSQVHFFETEKGSSKNVDRENETGGWEAEAGGW